MHTLDALRQKNGGLPSRICSTDNDDFFPATQLRFDKRCAIVHASAFEPRQVLDSESPIFGPGGDDQGASLHARTAVHCDRIRLSVAHQFCGASRNEHLSAEFLRLRVSGRREVLA